MPEVMSMKEIRDHYPEEWILVEVTALDRGGRTRQGRLIVHSSDREQAVEQAAAFHREHPECKTIFFYSGPAIPEGVTVLLYAQV